ncbi:MAG: hypothetical protein Q9213_000711, partial [Squamulea squamosa]
MDVPPSRANANQHGYASSYDQLLQEAREQYSSAKPPFTVPKKCLRSGHPYKVWLAGPGGQYTERTAMTKLESLTVREWDEDDPYSDLAVPGSFTRASSARRASQSSLLLDIPQNNPLSPDIPTTRRKRYNRSEVDSLHERQKRFKASDIPTRTVNEIIRQDRGCYEGKGIRKPPFVTKKDPFATPKGASELTVFLANEKGENNHHAVQAYSGDYRPAYQYWIVNVEGHERIVTKWTDQETGFHLRIWYGHDYGAGETIVGYGTLPRRKWAHFLMPHPKNLKLGRIKSLWKGNRPSNIHAPREVTPDMTAFIEPLTPPTTRSTTQTAQSSDNQRLGSDQHDVLIQPGHATTLSHITHSAATDWTTHAQRDGPIPTHERVVIERSNRAVHLSYAPEDEHPGMNTPDHNLSQLVPPNSAAHTWVTRPPRPRTPETQKPERTSWCDVSVNSVANSYFLRLERSKKRRISWIGELGDDSYFMGRSLDKEGL